MTWIRLRGKFNYPGFDKALITTGKIVVALQAISSFLDGLSGIGQALMVFYRGEISLILFLIIFLLGAFQVALGYGYFFLLDMNKSGRLVSLAKFFCELGAGLSIIFSPFVMLIGLIMLFKDPMFGFLLIFTGGIMLLMGLGLNYFLEERERLQIAENTSESLIGLLVIIS